MKRLLAALFLCASFAAAQICPSGFALVGGICISTSVVNGSSNLTTVGAIPYVSAAYTLNQDAANFFWDSANHRLGLGDVSPIAKLVVIGDIMFRQNGNSAVGTLRGDNVNQGPGGAIQLGTNNAAASRYVAFGSVPSASTGEATFTELARMAAATGNWLFGGTTDGNYKVDVQLSGSSGTLRVYDQTPTTGSTKVVFALGAADAASSDLLTNQGRTRSAQWGTASNCSSSASPAVCGASSAGSVVVAAAATTVQVNTTAVNSNSQVLLMFDSSLGTKLGVTCNTTVPTTYGVSARGANNFTITSTAPAANPACFSYFIMN
jgi:hypothetical protein